MSHFDTFSEYYRKFFSNAELITLVKQEAILSRMIDDDIVSESIIIDEIIIMYELVRDECVRRLEMMLDRGAGLSL